MNKLVITPLTNDYSDQIIDVVLPIQQIEFGVPITIDRLCLCRSNNMRRATSPAGWRSVSYLSSTVSACIYLIHAGQQESLF